MNHNFPLVVVFTATFIAVVTTLISGSSNPNPPSQKLVPIIGYFVSPLEECIPPPQWVKDLGPVNGCVESYYPRWLEMSGARVIPVPFNATQAHLEYLLPRLNGVLFPGGGMREGPVLAAYLNTLGRIVDWTMEANTKRNDPMLLWGTCFGFQMMAASIARNLSVVTGGFTGMYPLMMALNFTAYQPSSVLFGDKTTPENILALLRNQPTTLNWHHAGITPDDWRANKYLSTMLRPLSMNTEPSGQKTFVSAYEAVSANIFASQFHPERPPFEFSNPGIGHTESDIMVSQWLSRFVVGRAKLNNHQFENPADGEKLVVEQHPRVYDGLGTETFYIIGSDQTRSGLKEDW